MKLTATGATDGANIVLFWPDNLPDDADELLQDDPGPLIESMRESGRLLQFPCDGDGEYTVAVFVGDDPPAALVAHCRDEDRIPSLVASGDGYFGGAEYMFKHDASLMEQYPRMCEKIVVPAGRYAGRVFRTEISDEFRDAWLLDQTSARAIRVWELQTTLTALSIAGVFAIFASPFFVAWIAWYFVVAAAAVAIVAAVAVSHTSAYQAVTQARREFKHAFPSYVVELKLTN